MKVFCGDGLGPEGEVSVGADDAKAFAAEMLCAGGSDEKGDIASCLCETRSKVAADGTGTNDKNLHTVSDARACGVGARRVAFFAAVGAWMWSWSQSRSWWCSRMHTSLLRECNCVLEAEEKNSKLYFELAVETHVPKAGHGTPASGPTPQPSASSTVLRSILPLISTPHAIQLTSLAQSH
jgi:hypothetical protein